MSQIMSNSTRFPLAAAAVLTIALLAACDKKRDSDSAPQAEVPAEAAPAPGAPIVLKDVIENDARYIIGISYPPQAAKYPGLAQALHGYAEQARADLLKQVASIDAAKQHGPYDLTLNFSLLAETSDVVAVAADGSSFTGGAHGTPLVARFVWLPRQNRLLASDSLFADSRSWTAISDYTREQLHAALSQRVDADELPPTERAEVMRSVGKMIDAGTEPVPASFAAFEPVLAPQGDKLMGLRFVFPPYQVGPYVDGVRTVEVPTTVLSVHLAPEYRGMFVAVKPAAVAEAAPTPTDTPVAPTQ
jgi:Deacetylase PdaC